MRLLVITSLLGSATSFADESTEARVGPATKNVPNLAAATQQATSPKQATQKPFGLSLGPGQAPTRSTPAW